MEAWIAALRSGQYKQCRNRLKDGDGFCCLGVLCDIVDPTQWISDTNPNTVRAVGDYYSIDRDKPPAYILNKYNLDSNLVQRLMELNDIERRTFNEIADYLAARFGITDSQVDPPESTLDN